MNIDFKKDEFRFNARSSAIIFNKDKTKILLFKIEDDRDYYLLPGGRIKFNEDSLSAIKREIKEELDLDLDFKLCSVQENFVKKANKEIMQYCFCYKAIYKDNIENNKFVCKDNENQYFYWIDIDKLDNYKVYPKSTYKLLKSDSLEHIVEQLEI